MAVAEGIITARGGATSHAAVVARQIGKPCVAGSAALDVNYAGKAASCSITGHRLRRGRLAEPRRHDRRPVPRPAADGPGPVRGPARAPEDPRLGGRRSAGWASGPTPTSPRRPRRRAATAPRASGCAAPSTCSARASGSRSCAARSSSPNEATRAKAKAAAGEALTDDEREAVATFDAAMAKLEVLQQGDFEGIFKAMDGLPVVIRLIDPPLHEFLPNLEEQLVKVTRAESTGGASRGGPASSSRRSSRCTSRTRCSACAASASA